MPWEKTFDQDHALEQAMQIFWARGYAATSMQDLMDGMGINRGSLYDTFAGKRALFMAALERYDHRHRRAWLADLETRHTPAEALRRLFDGWTARILADRGSNGCFLTNTALELAAHDDEVGDLVARSQKELEAFFRRTIRRGQKAGQFSSRNDPVKAARSLLAALLGMLVLARSRPEPRLLRTISNNALKSLD